MCGTLMQILGEAAALFALDALVKPAFGGGVLVDTLLFLVKGFTTFYIYKWFQCSTNGVMRHPLEGTSFWHALLGGVIGMFTLMLTGMLLNEQRGGGGIEELVTYGIEAVVLNLVYGVTANMVHDMAVNSLRNYR
jgi:uncharacterized membrane protein YvlD (DUF360 family)